MNLDLRRAIAVYERRRELEGRDTSIVRRAADLAVAAGDCGSDSEPTRVDAALTEVRRDLAANQAAAQRGQALADIRAGRGRPRDPAAVAGLDAAREAAFRRAKTRGPK